MTCLKNNKNIKTVKTTVLHLQLPVKL